MQNIDNSTFENLFNLSNMKKRGLFFDKTREQDVHNIVSDISYMTNLAYYNETIRRGLHRMFNHMKSSDLSFSTQQTNAYETLNNFGVTIGQKRFDHAIRRLKDNGLYISSMNTLVTRLVGMTYNDFSSGFVITCMLYYFFGYFTTDFVDDIKITEDDWSCAIELTMGLVGVDVWSNTSDFYINTLKNNINILYILVYFTTRLRLITETVEHYQKIHELLLHFRDEFENYQNLSNSLDEQMTLNKEYKQSIDNLRFSFDKKKQQYEKRIRRLEHDVEILKSGYILDDNESDDDFEIIEAIDCNDTFDDGTDDTTDDSCTNLYNLPDEGVLFVGGHPNMLKKIKELHPYWMYQAGKSGFKPSLNTNFIFVWNKHLSHKDFKSLRSGLQSSVMKNTPMVYVTSTNMAKLEHEMRLLYTNYCNGNSQQCYI